MGTVKNGKKWLGVCVNGKLVEGLAKNGTIFYRKDAQPVEYYKRRLMIGDVIDNKKLYLEFPDDLMNLFQDTSGALDIITFENGDTISIENNKGIEECDVLYNKLSEGLSSYLYSYYDGVNLKEFLAPSSGKVASIYNQKGSAYNPYRMIKIEDPNIRPIKIGDKIVTGTKMYFVFPDEILSVYDELVLGLSIIESDNGDISFSNNDSSCFVSMSSGRYGLNIYTAEKSENKISNVINNTSYFFEEQIVGFGEVINILDTCPLTKLIMVDETTLG